MNWKQRSAFLIAIFYIASITGLALDLHYCGGKVVEVSLFGSSPACKMCKAMQEMHKSNNCCKDSKVNLQVKDDHKIQTTAALKQLFGAAVDIPLILPGEKVFLPEKTAPFNFKAPPSSPARPLYLLNANFRI